MSRGKRGRRIMRRSVPVKIVVAGEHTLNRQKIELVKALGATVDGVRWRPEAVEPDEIPIILCLPSWRQFIKDRRVRGLPWLYFDNGYFHRKGWRNASPFCARRDEEARFRLVLNGFQKTAIEARPSDRFDATGLKLKPWRKTGSHIVVAVSPPRYVALHGIETWQADTLAKLKRVSKPSTCRGDPQSCEPQA